MDQNTRALVLTLECEDRTGIVSAVAGFLADQGCNILDSQQFNDPSGQFFMRVEAEQPAGADLDALQQRFSAIAAQWEMSWRMADSASRTKTLIMVSHAAHCLNELLELWSSNLLDIEPVAIVSNHESLRYIADRYKLPFHHIPLTPANKPQAEAQLLELVDQTGAELIVLARYMQILSDHLCEQLSGRAINIHHSFLPGFKGARPYHQAYDRGVKLIGATAHYVTADLDEGPIIEQSVIRVDHRASPASLATLGRQAERAALAQAVAWHVKQRVLLAGHRTVIFS